MFIQIRFKKLIKTQHVILFIYILILLTGIAEHQKKHEIKHI